MKPEFTAQNPIVEAATRLRARKELGKVIDHADDGSAPAAEDAEQSLRLLAQRLADGAKRLNAILGAGSVRVVTLEKPLRLRIRFRDDRVTLDLDEVHQLVRIAGAGLDGDYQFDLSAAVPALINVSKISTEAGYGEALTASFLLRVIAQDAELPRPPHLDGGGPLQF